MISPVCQGLYDNPGFEPNTYKNSISFTDQSQWAYFDIEISSRTSLDENDWLVAAAPHAHLEQLDVVALKALSYRLDLGVDAALLG